MAFDVSTRKFIPESVSGVWVDYIGGSRLKVARWGNSVSAEQWRLIGKRLNLTRQIRDDTLTEEQANQVSIDVMATSILMGWEGSTLEYSVANAKLLLSVEVFRNAVKEIAQENELFYLQEVKESSQALKKTSSGISSGEKT